MRRPSVTLYRLRRPASSRMAIRPPDCVIYTIRICATDRSVSMCKDWRMRSFYSGCHSTRPKVLHLQIFETIHPGALDASCELAERDGPCATYEGSLASNVKLHYEMWGATPSSLWDWAGLKAKIHKHGLQNSLLTVPMPTTSTSQIPRNNSSFEPYTSNIYTRLVFSGEFQVVNPHLLW
ncbi:unnamed protein product [Mycena citricolor]|uniref:Ribonucleotide reductase large subunit C-terminal domain-containing protein n=1 Tax=Mycena citricolor TaxID=2018698 RepID=A0AAD2HKR8_9AGAR|nr:unnamed protein product [Mycena citricolor]